MKPGSELVPFVIEASPQSMREWSVFLADPNQIHLEVEAVKALGLGDRLINQGPANLAYVMNLLAANFPGSVHLIGGADVAAEVDAKRAIKQGTELAAAL